MSKTIESKFYEYSINKKKYKVNYSGSTKASFGEKVILSNENTDLTYKQSWYPKGYNVFEIFNNNEFEKLQSNIEKLIQDNISTYKVDTKLFRLEKYHKFVTDNNLHYSITSFTRDLFPENFNFSTQKITKKLENIFGMYLSNIDPDTNKKLHIIIRINRPLSNDFNPPHKDIYESLDRFKIIPKLINFWIPICGVTEKSTLPLVENSHFLSEDTILRINDKTIMNNNSYRVRGIINWNNSNELTKPTVKNGQVLMFSPHLIHGLALNEQNDTTRVALEFRLFEKK